MITVVLAEDHAVVRQGFKAILDAAGGIYVLGEAADGLAALDAVARLRPDVLVTDISMPGLNGLDLAREARRRSVNTRVVILSMHTAEAYVVQALRNGASAFVLKDADAEELLNAIRSAALGERYLAHGISVEAVDDLLRRGEVESADSYDLLTHREREVLQLTAEGLSSTQTAERLVISPRTVESHRANLMRKLGVRNQAELVRYAVARGLVSGPG